MDFANFLVFVIFATNFIEISTASSWEPNVRKYESYDLEKGPVFYEAYYPDEKTDRYTRDSKNLQEKRFFDRGTVLEKVFQIPTDELRARYPYSDNVQRIDDRLIPIGRGELFYDRNPEGYPPIPSIKTYEGLESTDIENLSSNTANNYPRYLSDNLRLDDGLTNGYRTTRQLSDTTDPLLRTRPSLSELENLSLLENILEDQRSKYLLQRRPRYLEDRKNTANDLNIGSDLIVSSLMPKKNPDPISGLFGEKEEAQTQNEQLERLLLENSNLRQKEEEIALETARNRILNLARLENIFEPRPQIINYVFSKNNVKKSPPGLSQKMLSNNLDREMHKNVSKKNSESVSTNYGNNNLIRDELKREPQGREDAKVTSIVISETPEKPHKIRHHHGERPKRDWSHRLHQTSLPALKT